MIKFFRKIRQNLLMENKTGKYFKYAIGEIVLVVIGILIALSINNWNEDRKQKETLHSIYQIIKDDISTDIIEINAFINEYELVRKPAFEIVLNKNPSKEAYTNNPEYLTVLDGFKDFEINKRGFELLKNQMDNSSIGQQNLASKINLFYNQHLIEINVSYSEMTTAFTNNLNAYKELPWLSTFLLYKETDEAIDYMIDNPLQKNRIAIYYLVYRIYVNELQKFKTNGEEIIKQIDANN